MNSRLRSTIQPRTWAIFQALFVAFLWSTSWVLIKIGLEDIPALSFAGLRYSLAFLMLLPFSLRSDHLSALRTISKRMWLSLILLGILFYTVTQGAQYIGLSYLPAITVNLLLSFTTVLVALIGFIALGERPTIWGWAGTGLYLFGAIIYFYPASFPSGQVAGLVIVLFGVSANALSAVLGRYVNRNLIIAPILVTVISMGIGAITLLITGIANDGLPKINLQGWTIILWLAAVNSAYAFTLWNRTLRTISAMESSLINSTMLIQIPVLALIFLGEEPSSKEILGMVLAGLGILAVQLAGVNKS